MTEKQFNDQIKKLAKNNRISYPENYDAFICKVLEELPEEPEEADRRSRWQKKREKSGWAPMPALLLAVLIIVTAGASAGAVVHGYLKRMETMPEQVKEELVDSIEESEKDVDSFSREFTKEEKERGKQLATEYEAGKRYPEKELAVLEDENMASEYSLCFVRTNSTFYLPEKELTDEELLEIIDFYFKRDYSLMAGHQEREDLKQVEDGELSRKEAIILARQQTKAVYGINVDGWKAKVEKYIPYHKKEAYYSIQFTTEDFLQEYTVEISEKTKECTFLSVDNKKESHYKDGISVTQKEIKKIHQKALDILAKLDSESSFSKMQCLYMEKSTKKPSLGIIDFIYFQNKQQGYIVRYSLHTKTFFSISKSESLLLYRKDYKRRAEKKKQTIYYLNLSSNVAEKEAN